MKFELCLLATEPGPHTARQPVRGTEEMLTVSLPPVVDAHDLVRVQPVTRGFWPFTESSDDASSEAILTLAPEAVARVQSARIRGVFAIIIDGEVTGRMIIPQRLQGRELPIAGTFTENEARVLAHQIKSHRGTHPNAA